MLINVFVTLIRAVIYVVASMLGAFHMFIKLNNSIIYSNMKFFDSNPTGRIINRLSKDVLAVDDEIPT